MVSPINHLKFSAVLIFLLFTSLVCGQAVTKVFDKSYTMVAEIDLKQSRGPLTIEPSTDGKVRVVTEMSVEAEDKEIATAFLAKMETKVTEMSDRLIIKTGLDGVRNWTQKNNNIKIVFQDGSKFTNLKNFEIATTLYLPETKLLKLESRFEKVEVDPGVKIVNLELSLHNAKFRSGSISGNLELEMRFGEIEMDDVGGNVSGKLHNTQGRFGDVGEVRLEARFTKLRMKTLKSLDLESHNSRLEAQSITGSIEIEDRFGTYVLGSTGNAKIDTHNGSFEVENSGEYRIEGRFGNFDFDRIDDLIVRDNHNCNYDIKELGTISGSGKFTDFDVERLGQKAELKLENGHFRVAEVSPEFRGVEVNGSFFEVKLNFRKPADYRLLVDFHFGNLRLPDNLVVVRKIKEMASVEMEMNTPNASADSPIINIKGQNGKLYID